MSTELSKPTQSISLASIKERNVAASLVAAGALQMLVEQIAVDCQLTEDAEQRRKGTETLMKVAAMHEVKAAPTVFLPLSFSIVTDPNEPQVAPARRKQVQDVDISDAVLVIPPKAAEPEPMPIPSTQPAATVLPFPAPAAVPLADHAAAAALLIDALFGVVDDA